MSRQLRPQPARDARRDTRSRRYASFLLPRGVKYPSSAKPGQDGGKPENDKPPGSLPSAVVTSRLSVQSSSQPPLPPGTDSAPGRLHGRRRRLAVRIIGLTPGISCEAHEVDEASSASSPCSTASSDLLRNHSDRPEPRFYQLRPSRNRRFLAAQPKRIPARHIHMHFCGHSSLPERRIVHERVLYRIRRIILRLKQERRRRPVADVKSRIQRETCLADRQMPRIESQCKIRAAAFLA